MKKDLMSAKDARKLLDSRTDAVVKELSRLGIPAVVDKDAETNSPAQFGLSLSLSSNRKKLLVRPDGDLYRDEGYDENIEVLPGSVPQITVDDYSEKHRQAVLTLTEEARTLARDITLAPHESHENYIFRNNFGLVLPGSTEYTVASKRILKDGSARAKVTAKVPATATSFLIGFDEKHMFISMLKNRVRTVEEAHRALLPKQLRRRTDYVRQGEFFFVPATKKEIESIADIMLDRRLEHNDGEETDHWAQIVTESDDGLGVLVSGAITNDRHATLFFDRWMRVIPNEEQPGNGNSWD
jgi:hypothetical protein